MGNPVGHCAVCNSKILENTVYCPKCETPHCESCWSYNGSKCGIYGCGNQPNFPQALAAAQIVAVPRQTSGSFSWAAWFMVFMITAMFFLREINSFIISDLATVKPGEVVVRFNWFNRLVLMSEPGTYYFRSLCGTTHVYSKSQLVESKERVLAAETDAIRFMQHVCFSDGEFADIYGSFQYQLPSEGTPLTNLTNLYGSRQAIEHELIWPQITRTFNRVAAGMTSGESATEGRAELLLNSLRGLSEYLEERGMKVSHFTISDIQYNHPIDARKVFFVPEKTAEETVPVKADTSGYGQYWLCEKCVLKAFSCSAGTCHACGRQTSNLEYVFCRVCATSFQCCNVCGHTPRSSVEE